MASSFRIVVNGKEFERVISVNVKWALEAVCGMFTLVSAVDPEEPGPYPLAVGSTIKIYLGGMLLPVIDGYIEKLSVAYGVDGHRVTVEGRDKTADVVDTHVYKLPATAGGTLKLRSVLQKAIEQSGIPGITVTSVTTAPGYAAISSAVESITIADKEIVSPEPGEKLFDFLARQARDKQILLTKGLGGSILMTRAPVDGSDGFAAEKTLQNSKDPKLRPKNNILSGSLSLDITNVYSEYIVAVQESPASKKDVSVFFQGGDTSNVEGLVREDEPGISRSGISELDNRPTRRWVDASSQIDGDAERQYRADLERNRASAKRMRYEVNVQGFFSDSADTTPWQPNMLVLVNDDFAGLEYRELLIYSVNFSWTANGGSVTSMSIGYPGAYSIEKDAECSTQYSEGKYQTQGNIEAPLGPQTKERCK